MTDKGSGSIRDRVVRVEHGVTTVLRVGVALSLAVIAAGLLLSALHHPRLLLSREELVRLVEPGAAFPHTLHDVVRGVAGLHGQAVTTAGIIILLLLPPLRVALVGLTFVFQRDRIYVLVTLGVLGLLFLSLLLGQAG